MGCFDRKRKEGTDMKKKVLASLLALSLCVGLLAGCGGSGEEGETADTAQTADTAETDETGDTADGENTIYFGVNYELTGSNPIIGEAAIRGIDMAVNTINANGGVTVAGTTYQLAYKALDNGFNTEQSALNA